MLMNNKMNTFYEHDIDEFSYLKQSIKILPIQLWKIV